MRGTWFFHSGTGSRGRASWTCWQAGQVTHKNVIETHPQICFYLRPLSRIMLASARSGLSGCLGLWGFVDGSTLNFKDGFNFLSFHSSSFSH